MTGSEKQIKWANQIIAKILNNANSEKIRLNEKIGNRIEKQSDLGNTERAEELKVRLNNRISEIDEGIGWIDKITNASKVIDLRLVADQSEQVGANWYRLAGDIALMAGTRL